MILDIPRKLYVIFFFNGAAVFSRTARCAEKRAHVMCEMKEHFADSAAVMFNTILAYLRTLRVV